ncbi:lytic transglycosylase domain-containing protein [Aureimonas sp. AU12]|uniref:lytic transglycosylase domain-containing protein n=1 Tax=Aureimonas sp. AU12 TaxID=1638161 RepID=UPI0007819EF1|nr:transglycosylase SLT domain-containing protein [Aureimonas sp. AU12]
MATLALLAPLTLSACVSDGDKLTGTANLAPKAGEGTDVASSTSTAPRAIIEIAGADKGPTRVTLPSSRPIEAERGARVVAAKAVAPVAAAPAAAASAAAVVVQAEPKGLTTRAVETAIAAKDAAKDGVVAAKDTVVAGASRVGAGASAVANVSVATMKNVAQAVGDTISGDPKIDRLIAEAADENDIPRELAYAVVRVESHYNPRARGSGVYGLSQIKPATARGLGFSGPAEGLLDPETNLRYGMRYLKGAWEQGGGDVCQAAMKYKGGHRTTVMSKSASVYCSNVKRHIAAFRARKTPAMSPDATLVAAVEPTVRPGLIARTVAASPARQPAKIVIAKSETLPGVPASAAAIVASPQGTSGAAAATASVAMPKAAPRVAERDVTVADNRPVANANGAIPLGGMVGGRVVRQAPKPLPDADRFGGSFDASSPSGGAPAGGLGFN